MPERPVWPRGPPAQPLPTAGSCCPALRSAHLGPRRVGSQPARASQCLPPATLSPQVNTTLPARTLLFGWGPYALLYLYATVADVSSISPRLQMVQTPPGPELEVSPSLRLSLLPHLSFLLSGLLVVSPSLPLNTHIALGVCVPWGPHRAAARHCLGLT